MTIKRRIVFLIVLSMISVFFAEVISGSMKFPLFDLWGYIVVIPLYGLHTILLLSIIHYFVKDKPIVFSTIYLAGVLFGLYEAYITKVLWVGLSDDPTIVMNIEIIDYIVLVFFWHPLFSLIIPALVFEKLCTNTDYIFQGLPPFVKRVIQSKYGLLLIMVVIGFFSSFNGLPDSLTLSELSLLIPIALIFFMMRKKGMTHSHSLAEILPKKTGVILGSVYLLFIYIGLGLYVKPEVVTLEAQIPIWISYLLFGSLFGWKIGQNRRIKGTNSVTTETSIKTIVLYSVVIVLSGILFVIGLWMMGIQEIALITTWILWILCGIFCLVYSIFKRMEVDV